MLVMKMMIMIVNRNNGDDNNYSDYVNNDMDI